LICLAPLAALNWVAIGSFDDTLWTSATHFGWPMMAIVKFESHDTNGEIIERKSHFMGRRLHQNIGICLGCGLLTSYSLAYFTSSWPPKMAISDIFLVVTAIASVLACCQVGDSVFSLHSRPGNMIGGVLVVNETPFIHPALQLSVKFVYLTGSAFAMLHATLKALDWGITRSKRWITNG